MPDGTRKVLTQDGKGLIAVLEEPIPGIDLLDVFRWEKEGDDFPDYRLGNRFLYAFTPDLFVRGFIQWNSKGRLHEICYRKVKSWRVRSPNPVAQRNACPAYAAVRTLGYRANRAPSSIRIGRTANDG